MNYNDSIIVSPLNYNYEYDKDKRFLIPFRQGTKFGFANKQKQIIIPPKFDIILDDFLYEDSIVRVGKYTAKIYEDKKTPPTSTVLPIFGLLKSDGSFLVPIEYEGISYPSLSECFTLKSLSKGYSAIDSKGNTIIPFGKYNYIEGFERELARVKVGGKRNGLNDKDSLWGIIDEKGNEILLPIYSYIDSFYNRDTHFTKLKQTDGKELEFDIFDKSVNYSGYHADIDREYIEDMRNYEWLQEYRESQYNDFNGSYAQDVMGYSDEDIYDAFDGDPEAYWNID